MKQNHITIGPYWSFRKLQRVPAHKISYLEFGDPNNSNILLCIHGLTRNAHDFDYLANEISKNYRVISIDMVGRGDSEWFKNRKYYQYDTYIKDIILFLDALNIKSVNFLGTSMGGLIGMAIATYYPKYIKNLIINDVGPELPKHTLTRIRKYINLNPEFDNLDEAEQHLKIILKYFGITEDEHWKHITQYAVKLNENGKYKLKYDPMVTAGDQNSSDDADDNKKMVELWYLWKKIKIPILLIQGSKSDILLESTVKKMQSFRDFNLYVIDAGHAPALMQQTDIKVIYDWLLSK